MAQTHSTEDLIRSAEWTLGCNVEELKQARAMREHHQYYVDRANTMEARALEGIATCKARVKDLKAQLKEER